MTTSIAIVGSGFAGVEAVKRLAGLCGERIDCTWITQRPELVFLPSLPEVAGGRLEPPDVKWGIDRFAREAGAELIVGRVTAVEERRLLLENGDKIGYDYLILATGAAPAFFNVPGAREHAVPLYSVEDALKIRSAARQASRVVIVGAGFVGVEVAGELRHAHPDLHITIVDMLDKPLRMLGNERASILTEKMLRKMGIELFMNARVTRVDEGRIETTRGSLEADLVIWAAGLQANRPEIRIEGVSYTKGGYVSVDRYLRAASRVYAVGDVSCLEVEGCMPLKMVREAIRQARTAAYNLLAELEGRSLVPYKPLISNCMPLAGVTLGPGRAVLIIGKKFSIYMPVFVEAYKDLQRRLYARLLTKGRL